MAHITADRVRESTTTSGSGDISLSGALGGFRAFSSVLVVGDTCYYAIASLPGSEWEVGVGTYTATNTLARTTILASSNSNLAVNFSAGTKEVFITAAASKIVQLDNNDNSYIGIASGVSFNQITGLSSVVGSTPGTASVGTSTTAARADHVHPAQTTITGNAGTASSWQTARTLTIGASGKSVNGSANVSWTLAEIGAIPAAEKGVANGVATLDSTGKVPATQLPSYVDDVLEYANLAAFPVTGESGKIYVAIDTNKTYRWGGSSYVYITSGAVDSVNGQTGVVSITTITGNAGTATKLQSARTISLTGDVTGSASFDGSADIAITAAVANDSHTHSNYMFRSSSPQTDPNVVFTSSAYRFNPNANNPTNDYYAIVTYGNESNVTGQLATHFQTGQTFTRAYNSSWSAWRTQLDSSNYNSYAPTLTGGGASGTWGISVTGSASTWQTGRTLTIGNTGKTVNGGADVSWSRSEIGVPLSTYTTSAGDDSAESCVAYISGISLLGQSDGALYSHVYSASWKHQIYGDYRTGQIVLRGKNNGTWGAWRTVLDSSNYNSYAPTLTGGGASGTWGISVTGNAATSTSSTEARWIVFPDGPRDLSDRLPTWKARSVAFDFVNSSAIGGSGNYSGVMTFVPWLGTTASTGDPSYQLSFSPFAANSTNSPTLRVRAGIDTTWGAWSTLLHSGNYNSYAPTLTGTGASGTWGIGVTGNAGTATSLATARTIGMTGDVTWTSAAFNGTANVTGTSTLANSGVTAGTYTKLTVDAKGRATAGTSLSSADVTTALGYTPANGSAYLPLTGGTLTGALGGTTASFSGAVNWGSGNINIGNPRSLAIGYTSGNYGGCGYGVTFGATTDTYAINDLASWWQAFDGLVVYAAPAGGVGTAITWTSVLDARRSNNALFYKGRTVLDSTNYTSYSPALTGTGASGTWGISVTGNAASATSLQISRNINGTAFNGTADITTANWGTARTITIGSTGKSVNGSANVSWSLAEIGAADATNSMTFRGSVAVASQDTAISPGYYTRTNAGDSGAILTFNAGGSVGPWQMYVTYQGSMEFRNKTDSATWTAWKSVLTSINYNSYSPTLTGGGASGTWGINITGSAATATSATSATTATTLATARNINGTAFNGSADITTANWGTERTITIGATGKSVNGSANTAWTLAEIGAPSTTGSGASGTWAINISGSAATATDSTKLPLVGGNMSGAITFTSSSMLVGQSGGVTRGYVYADTGGIGFLANNGAWAARVDYNTYNFNCFGNISTSGNVYASGEVTAYSDERVKANWRGLDEGFVEKLAGVKSGVYDRTDIKKTQVGVSAQSLQEVIPHAVHPLENGFLTVSYGNAALAAAIELSKEIVKLKEEIEKLKAKLN